MKRLALATVLTLFALPGSALAASSRGVVLSYDAAQHAIQVVDSGHAVHAYRFRGRLPKLHTGSRISFQQAGQTIGDITVAAGASRTVSFSGKVIGSNSSKLALRLADGKAVSFSSKELSCKPTKPNRDDLRAHAAATVSIDVQGLRAGVRVLVTETVVAHGGVTIAITDTDSTTRPM